MKDYTSTAPVFSSSIEVVETTDPAHADNINASPKQLLQNDLVLISVLNPDLVAASFARVFSELGLSEEAEVMTKNEIETSIKTEWNGESSNNSNAMSSREITMALSTPWNGEASSDMDALTPEQINEAIKT